MSPPSLKPLTRLGDDLFRDRSISDCMTPLTLSRFLEEGGFDLHERSPEFEISEENVYYFHGERLVGPSFECPGSEVGSVLRLLCHLLVDAIAEDGIPEVYESLREFCDYYNASEAAQGSATERWERDAVRGAQRTRPSFTVERE